jgi:hypothetical protein
MTLGFIYGTLMLPKSDENHIACHVAYEVAIYLISINDITIEVYFLIFHLIAPFSNNNNKNLM